jgi:glycosyltransferase involved in cell wall biosynthesis
MEKKKRILYFMPYLSLEDNAGNKTRVISVLRYLKSRNFDIDYFGVKDWIPWTGDNIEKMLATGLVDRVFVGERHIDRNKPLKRLFCYKIPELIKEKIYGIDGYGLNSAASFHLCKQFNKVLEENDYDYVLVNYSLWANLLRTKKYTKNAKTIIDTHDFITFQVYKNGKREVLGRTITEEIKRLNYADEVWAISVDEQYVFTQLLDSKVKLVPVIIPPNNLAISTGKDIQKKYDLIYVASANDFNKKSAKWFIDHVHSLLPKDYSICIVGQVTEYIEDRPNIDKIKYVENLGELYQQSKMVICPMLEGTGLKIKVVEAMAHSLPVVCTLRGIDGLPNKINNGCLIGSTPEEFAENIIKVLSDKELYDKLAAQGHDLYQNFFTLETRYKSLDAIFGINTDN